MSRCGCEAEEALQSEFSPGAVEDSEAIVFVLDTEYAEVSFKNISNSKLKSGTFSVCRATHCSFDTMITAVVGPKSAPRIEYKGYVWTSAEQIRAILAKRNAARDKNPSATPRKVGAFCVLDDGESGYPAHAVVSFSKPTSNFWELHETVAARGDLLLAFQAEGHFVMSAEPPFPAAIVIPTSEKSPAIPNNADP